MLNEMIIPLLGCNYSYADAIAVDLIKPVALISAQKPCGGMGWKDHLRAEACFFSPVASHFLIQFHVDPNAFKL